MAWSAVVGGVVGVVGKWDKYLSSTGTSILRMPQMAPKGLQTYVGAPERGGATWGDAPTRPKLPRGDVYTKAPVNPTAELWHLRMGHPGAQVLQHLPNNVKISKNEAIKAIDCDECAVATAKNIVSRTPAERAKTPYYRLHFDLFEFDRAYNGNRYVAFFVDDATGTVHTELLNTKTELLDTVIDLQARIKKMGKDIAMLHSDNDTSLGKAFEKWAKDEGIVVEMSAPATQAQNGRAERSGGVVIAKARKMRIGARLPKDLWPEIILCAAYIHNRTPTSQNNWESPITKLKSWFAQKDQETAAVPPDTIDHLRAYGCRAYPLTMNTKLNKNRKDKLQPKAHIGYLVGYKARTIYRIWVPVLQKVIVTRDVTFNESRFFDPDEEDLSMKLRSTIEPLAETLELPEMPEHPDHPEQYLHERTAFDDDGELQHENAEQPQQQLQEQQIIVEAEEPPHLPTPERTPQPEVKPQRKKAVRDQGIDLSNVLPTRTRHHASAVAHREESDVEKKHDDYEETAPFQYAFAGAMMHRTHRENLPPEPNTWKEAMSMPSEHMQKWKEAAREELDTLKDKDTWSEMSRNDMEKGKRPLPVKWVFKYKLDASGYLERYKARLCVRGDLQPLSETVGNTRATTLTMRAFRMLMAVAAKFNLDAHQLDAVNAFVNSTLHEDERMHIELPEGFKRNGVVLKLKRALYGLRRSPRLWQEELVGTLRQLGLSEVPDEPCIMTNGDWLLVFYYVDDIVLLSRACDKSKKDDFIEKLKEKYQLKDIGELRWFLGIEVKRDRRERTLSLSQQAYIEKIAARFEERGKGRTGTPIARIFEKSEDMATEHEIRMFQQRIGSILYAAISTRPDVAFATAHLSQFLTNPSKEHTDAANQCLRYLHDTRHLVLHYGHDRSARDCVWASDAAFADDINTRKSTQAYLMKLFGGTVAWRSGKQDTVTTSSTEAELLALTHAAKESLQMARICASIKLEMDGELQIYCDNRQTINLVRQETPKLITRLRHVDIHQHWLRQLVQLKGTPRIEYIPTNEMPADGLTKPFSEQKMVFFREQLGLVSLRARGV